MSGLVLKLAPNERVLINGAVIENGDRRSKISIKTALLHKSVEGRTPPFPGQTNPASSVMGGPSAVKLFRTAPLTWNSAT